MPASTSLAIAICGSGPAGLAAACFLHDAGHRPVLYERFPEPRPLGAGLLLQPAGLAALRRIGCDGDALALGQPITGFRGATAPDGREIFSLSYARLARAAGPGLFGLGIHRAALFSVLWAAVRARQIPIETGCDVTAVERQASNLVPCAGTRRLAPCDLLVDATGARSALRGAAGVSAAPRPYSYGAVWTTLDNSGFDPSVLSQRYVRARHMIGILPVGRLPDGRANLITLFWSLKPGTHGTFVAAGLPAWRDAVERLWPETRPLLAQVTNLEGLTLARYGQLTMARPHQDRMVFIGDAAHCTSPQLGAGVTMALLDAAALTDALAATESLAAALAAYARRRRRHVRFYQAMSRLLTPAFQSDGVMLPWLRDTLMPRAGRLAWVDRRMMETFAGLALGPFAAATPELLAGLGEASEVQGAIKAASSAS
jgi:2-polyprenyl-6-methoxyphenol hydroxylase-like FAD-dependent oxidoreductase